MRNRGVKVKLSAKQKRKQGWNVVKDSAKDMLIGSTMRDLKAGANAGASHLKSAKHLGEAGGAALVGIAKQAVKEIPTNIKNVGRIAAGTLRGIFNHPDWYKYKGSLSVPAHNIMRPFTPISLKNVIPTGWSQYTTADKKSASGAGVTHIIQVNVGFNDMRNDEGFKLATIEAFKGIRGMLRSNLPYTQAAYDNFVQMACSVYIKAKMVEKLFGTYNYTRPDIPEYQRATQTIPYNTFERGVLSPTPISMLSDVNYANNLNNLRKLKAIINQIAIPRKLAEYLSWWVGSQFIDQAAPNPQIYTTMLRNGIIYTATDTETMAVTSSWDLATGSVQDIIDEALNLLDVFGILNADICKTERYGLCDIVLPENYNVVFLNDPEFFSILVNAYGADRTNTTLSKLFNQQYIRVDALEELNDVNLVGMSNALATWADVPVLVNILSQACYIQVDSDFDIMTNTKHLITGANIKLGSTVESNGAWLQVTGLEVGDNDVNVTTTSGTSTTTATYNNRISADIAASASGVTINIAATSVASDRRAPLFKLAERVGSNTYTLYINKANGNLELHTNYVLTATFTYTGTITVSGDIITITTGTATVPSAQVAVMATMGLETANWNIYELSYTISYPVTSSATAEVVEAISDLASWFTELVDYHLPIIIDKSSSVTVNGSTVGAIVRPPILLKECYKPMIFNYADISVVLYWMYLGLFSMD